MRGLGVPLLQERRAVRENNQDAYRPITRSGFRVCLMFFLPSATFSLYLMLRNVSSLAFSQAPVLVRLMPATELLYMPFPRLCMLFPPCIAFFTVTSFHLHLRRSPPAFLLRPELLTRGAHKMMSLPWHAKTVILPQLQVPQEPGQWLSAPIIVHSLQCPLLNAYLLQLAFNFYIIRKAETYYSLFIDINKYATFIVCGTFYGDV